MPLSRTFIWVIIGNTQMYTKESLTKQIDKRLGNFTVVAQIHNNRLQLELLSLFKQQAYQITYSEKSMPKQAQEQFKSVERLYLYIQKCLNQGQNISASDLACITLLLPESLSITFQLNPCSPSSLNPSALFSALCSLQQDQCQLRMQLNQLTGQLQPKVVHLPATVDSSTPFLPNFKLTGNVISHLKEQTWSSIFLEKQIKSSCEFEVELVRFRNKSLMVGVAVGGHKKLQSSHSYAGTIMMCLSEGQTSLYEKGGRKKATKGIQFEEGDRVRVKIDLMARMLSWWLADVNILWARLDKDLIEKGLFAKVEIMGVGDQVRFC